MNKSFVTIVNFIIAALFAFAMTNANAFLVDTSQQKVIMIGKGGAENMQPVKVQEIPASSPAQSSQYQPSAYQQQPSYQQSSYQQPSYPQNTQPTTKVTTTVSPVQSYAQGYTQYNQPTYNSYNQPQYNQYGNEFDRLAVSTNSAAVAVFDVATGRTIYEKNVDKTRSIASISKLMTAMVVLDSGEDLRQHITISANDLMGAKVASTNLKAGDILTRSEFLLLMLMKSENPAAKTLATNSYMGYESFIAAMNQKAQSLGMYNTRFSDTSGLNPRNVSTANDLIKMLKEIGTNPRYQTIRNFSTASSYSFHITNYTYGNRVYNANNTNRLVRSGNYPIGIQKTGHIREAGYCVVMETHINGRPSIVVLLGANASNKRWDDAENILGQLAYRN